MHPQSGHAQAGARVDNTILSAPNSAIVREMRTDVRTRNPLELEKMMKRSNVRSNDSCVHICGLNCFFFTVFKTAEIDV